jgi:hypothetical protein
MINIQIIINTVEHRAAESTLYQGSENTSIKTSHNSDYRQAWTKRRKLELFLSRLLVAARSDVTLVDFWNV